MVLKGLNPKRRYKYIPKDQRGEERPAIFHLRVIPPAKLAEIEDNEMTARPDATGTKMDTATMAAKIGTRTLLALRAGLTGWENIEYEDEQGNWVPAPYEENGDGEPTDDTLAVLHPKYRDELEEVLLDMNRLSEEDVKN